MRRVVRWAIGVMVLASTFGCAISPQLNVAAPPGQPEPIKTVALAPNGGILADAIGFELIKYGFEVFDTAQVTGLMVRMNLSEIEILEPQNLLKL